MQHVTSWRATIYLQLERNNLFGDFILRNNNNNNREDHITSQRSHPYCTETHTVRNHEDAVLPVPGRYCRDVLVLLHCIRRSISYGTLYWYCIVYEDSSRKSSWRVANQALYGTIQVLVLRRIRTLYWYCIVYKDPYKSTRCNTIQYNTIRYDTRTLRFWLRIHPSIHLLYRESNRIDAVSFATIASGSDQKDRDPSSNAGTTKNKYWKQQQQ